MAMKTIAFFYLLILLVGCKEISFQEPQPEGKKSLGEIPEKLHGTFLLSAAGDNSQDTLFINKRGYRIASDKRKAC